MVRSIKELREALEGKEMSFIELDNKMVQFGYCSVCDDGSVESIAETGSIVYANVYTLEDKIEIDFNITTGGADYDDFDLEVTHVNLF